MIISQAKPKEELMDFIKDANNPDFLTLKQQNH